MFCFLNLFVKILGFFWDEMNVFFFVIINKKEVCCFVLVVWFNNYDFEVVEFIDYMLSKVEV